MVEIDKIGSISNISTIQRFGLLDAAKLHPNVINYFKKLVVDVTGKMDKSLRYEQYFDDVNRRLIKLVEDDTKLQSMEKFEMLGSIEKCQRSAAILSAYMCKEFRNILVNQTKLQHVFIGQELYTDIDNTFSLQGPVPHFVLKRIHTIVESGIWEWWINLLSTSGIEDAKEGHPARAANMSGNIVVIFVVRMCGAVLAILCSISEFLKNILIERWDTLHLMIQSCQLSRKTLVQTFD